MAILKVARMGHPVLTKSAKSVDPADIPRAELQRLIDDMIETMHDERGVGLAGPQVHRSLRLFVMDPGPDENGEDSLRVLVNPVLRFPVEERIELWEGCLSVPGIRGPTERWAAVDVTYLDRTGQEKQMSFEGFPAAVVQHETDHLDGILFFERMPDLSRLAFDEEFGRYHESDEDEDGDAGPDD